MSPRTKGSAAAPKGVPESAGRSPLLSCIVRQVVDAEPTPELRRQLRAALRGPLVLLARSAALAAETLDGPDPEEAAVDILDAIEALESALGALAIPAPRST